MTTPFSTTSLIITSEVLGVSMLARGAEDAAGNAPTLKFLWFLLSNYVDEA